MSRIKTSKTDMKNIVAKFAQKFNKAQVYTDKKKDYKRKSKHRKHREF